LSRALTRIIFDSKRPNIGNLLKPPKTRVVKQEFFELAAVCEEVANSTIAGQADSCDNGAALMQFAVGFKLQGTTGHVVVNTEDALIAALKIKAQRPEALIMYVPPTE
jgi:hypothetical protein